MDDSLLVKPAIADRLEDASLNSLVYVGSRGEVRTRAYARTVQGIHIAAMSLFSGALIVANGLMFGAVGAVVAGIGASVFAFTLYQGAGLRTALEWLMMDQLDQAEAVARRYLSGPYLPATRARARGVLASVAAARYDFAGALELTEAALSGRVGRPSIQDRILRYQQIQLLVELDRVEEARAKLDQCGEVPEGDYLELQHRTAELYVAFAEGEHAWEPETLHEWGRYGLQVLPGAALLALVAWAFDELADPDMGSHLAAEALERWEPPTSRTMAKLDTWLRARVDPAL